ILGGTITETGYKLLDTHIGAIYGDSITLERAKAIVEKLEEKGFASTNVVFGVGSYTFQYQTRDSLGFAMKATYAVVNGEERLLFKDPKTDDGTKKSQRGRVVVTEDDDFGIIGMDGLNKEQANALKDVDLLQDVFVDGKLMRDESLSEIRARLQAA
ncbi:nicotinate phosphoribosyltransferase, partial [Bacillus cereus]|nr:nicotinate phosphoribosyltransferase [Bacillus cereus]